MTLLPISSLRATVRRSTAEFAVALAISLGAHGLLAVIVLAGNLSLTGPRESATLNVSQVTFSTEESPEASKSAARTEAAAVSAPPAPQSSEPVFASEIWVPVHPAEGDSPRLTEGDSPRFEGDRPRFEGDSPRFEGDRPQFDSPVPENPGSEQATVVAPASPERPISPEYPRISRRRGEEGDVTLMVTVDDAGKVSSVQVATSSGYPELDDAAVRAVGAAVFSPARQADRAVPSTVRLTLSFRLRQ